MPNKLECNAIFIPVNAPFYLANYLDSFRYLFAVFVVNKGKWNFSVKIGIFFNFIKPFV